MSSFPLPPAKFMRALFCLLSLVASAEPKELTIFAAASTATALTELKPELERATGATVFFNFAGSGELARQLKAKPAADVFLSADVVQMEKLQVSSEPLLSNTLVVIVPAKSSDAPANPAALATLKHLAIGDPSSVPVGTYARQWLQAEGAWNAENVVPLLDARAVLAAVATGKISAGVVYSTDATGSTAVKIAFSARERTQPKIVYPVAALTPLGRKAVEVLRSAQARQVFERRGFLMTSPSPR